ncbi:MAG: GAF domain-containing protein, partial [Firmicutes bacterium]|nr:GAF domain-containing protein [Bacillota bacterium]
MVAQLGEYNLNLPACKDCDDLNTLMQISDLVSITGDLNTVLKKSIEQINGIMGVTTGGVLLYDTKINRLVLQRPAFDMDNEKFMGYSREVINEEKPGMGASVKVFITGQPHISNYPLNDAIIRQEIVNCYNIRTSLTVPLVVNKKCLGALHLINAHKGYFSQVD